jgi:hypothetical protein
MITPYALVSLLFGSCKQEAIKLLEVILIDDKCGKITCGLTSQVNAKYDP